MFIFWKAQIGVSIGAGIISALTNAIQHESKIGVALWSIGISICGYVVMLLGFSLVAFVRAPFKLDATARTAHAEQLKAVDSAHSLALQEKESKIENVNLELKKQESKTAELEAANQDWANDYHYQQADEALKKLSDNAKAVVRYIYSHEKIDTGHTGRISIAGMNADATASVLHSELGGVPFIRVTREPDPMSGTRFYWEIVPGYKKALGDLLFRGIPSQSLN